MKTFTSLILLPCAAFAFSPLYNTVKKGTVVQNVINSKWTMMPEGDPAPEVSRSFHVDCHSFRPVLTLPPHLDIGLILTD